MHAIKRVLGCINFSRYQGNHKELLEVRDRLRFCGFPPEAKIRGGFCKTLDAGTLLVNISAWERNLPDVLATAKLKKAVKNLKTHVKCLANHQANPSERGTNSNEGLHRRGRAAIPKQMSPVTAELLVTKFIAQSNDEFDDFPICYEEWLTKRYRRVCELYIPTESFRISIPSIFGDGLSTVYREMIAPVVNGLDLGKVFFLSVFCY